MKRSHYLREAVLNFLQFLFPPEPPAPADKLTQYEREIEQRAMQRLEQRYTRDKAGVERQASMLQQDANATVHSWEEWCAETERDTDELDALTQGFQPGEMLAICQEWKRTHPNLEGFTEAVPSIRLSMRQRWPQQ